MPGSPSEDPRAEMLSRSPSLSPSPSEARWWMTSLSEAPEAAKLSRSSSLDPLPWEARWKMKEAGKRMPKTPNPRP